MFKPTNTELTDALIRYNPKLSRSSARTYSSQIKSINKKFADVDFNLNMKWYDKTVEGRLLKIKNLKNTAHNHNPVHMIRRIAPGCN